MSGLKKIVVFTATGDQGGSVARYLVKTGKYEVHGITRNTGSESSKAMEAIGVKMHQGDLEDVASYTPALEGLHGAFVNADFWAKYWTNGMNGPDAGEWEYGLSTRAIEACAKAGAKEIVYSTLEGVPYVPHMLFKQNVSKWAESKGYPVVNLYTSHYISNLTKFPDFLKMLDDGSYQLGVPSPDKTVLGNYAVEQTGGWVQAIFEDFAKFKGQPVYAAGESSTVTEWAQEISGIIGKPVKTLGLPDNMFDDYSFLSKAGVPEELILNYKGFYEGYLPRDAAASKKVYADAWDTKQWAAETGKLKDF